MNKDVSQAEAEASLSFLRDAWHEGDKGDDRLANFSLIKARGRIMLKARANDWPHPGSW